VTCRSLLSAWKDYLDNFIQGRPVIIIGDSQGAIVLANLIAAQVDPNPVVRSQLVSALLIGGMVAAPMAAYLVRRMPPRLLGSLVGAGPRWEERLLSALLSELTDNNDGAFLTAVDQLMSGLQRAGGDL